MRKRMISGECFGRLTTVSRAGDSRAGKPQWLCACSCGQKKIVMASDLRTGNTTSCGCSQQEYLTSARTHGHAHRSGKSPEYSTYRGMIRRCDNPKTRSYPRYGGRGITVCDRWRANFANFLEDMGTRPSAAHSIERNNTNGNYEPGNCRWATMQEQQNNRTNNRTVVHEGRTLTLSQLAELSAVSGPTLRKRLDAGWSIADAISLPASPISPQRTASRPIERRT